MRPLGVEAAAIIQAVQDLFTPDRGPTVAELAAKACVGRRVADYTVKNLKRHHKLAIVREREVAYRNRPVAEYGFPAPACDNADGQDLNACLSAWGR